MFADSFEIRWRCSGVSSWATKTQLIFVFARLNHFDVSIQHSLILQQSSLSSCLLPQTLNSWFPAVQHSIQSKIFQTNQRKSARMPDQAKPTNSGSSCSIPEESAQYLPKSTHRRQSTRRQSLRKPPPKSRSASIGCTTGATTSALRYSRSLSDASQRHGSLDSTRRPSLANINSHLASLLSLSSQVTRREGLKTKKNGILRLCC